MITKLLATKKISSKTHNQLKIKILFKFKFIILNKFKRGEGSSCINFSHKKKKLINTKTTSFYGRNSFN
jgi:hypothetical protein